LVEGNEFYSNDVGLQNSGTIGVNPAENKILIAQLTTSGELSFNLNLEVEIPNPDGGVFLINYVANNDTILGNEQLSSFLSYPFICGCRDANFLEFSNAYSCDAPDSCKTPIVLGCMDTAACNYDSRANFNVQSLCCYPGYCNDRDLAIVCPEIPTGFIKFYIYPNPSSDNVNLNLWLTETSEVFYSIENIFGVVIKSETSLGSFNGNIIESVNISELENSVYYFKVKIGSNEQRKIFIKN
jgi:hypothetical protein